MMSTNEPMPADRAPEAKPQQGAGPDLAAEAEAMEDLALAGFRLMSTTGPADAPEQLTYVRASGEHTDFVYLALSEGGFSTAVRYPVIPTENNFEQASGEFPAAPPQSAEPGDIVKVIREVLEWPRA